MEASPSPAPFRLQLEQKQGSAHALGDHRVNVAQCISLTASSTSRGWCSECGHHSSQLRKAMENTAFLTAPHHAPSCSHAAMWFHLPVEEICEWFGGSEFRGGLEKHPAGCYAHGGAVLLDMLSLGISGISPPDWSQENSKKAKNMENYIQTLPKLETSFLMFCQKHKLDLVLATQSSLE